ncbi:uncharacterized protein LOC129225929 [Uloborus diversus]|uniref:uncharacterized protein LOC129225929 n=1 Tax=Uloborus diversus TaxID=327109 RepID=UPI00240A5EB7|nr:uncharacterized protein LOC129225929 [Uloborus diversus]
MILNTYILKKNYIFPLPFILTICFIVYSCDKMINGNLRSFSKKLEKSIISYKAVIPSIVVFRGKSEKVVENCSQIHISSNISLLYLNGWQKLDSNFHVFAYSAYADKRIEDNAFIRILAVCKETPEVFCRIWQNDTESYVIKAEVKEMWINSWDFARKGRYYQPILVSCPLSSSSLPIAVSLVSKPCTEPRNIFKIHLDDIDKKQNFAICLKPLYFNEDVYHRLLEWLELQFILGADVVNIYAYKLHPKIWNAINSYSESGKVIVKNFSLPVDTYEMLLRQDKTMERLWQKRRYEMIVYNDCFYKHIHSHKYVINLDLDEAIVPKFHNSWVHLLENASLENPNLKRSASISVANVYFFDSFGSVTDNAIPVYMHMLRHIYRSANFTPPGFAQKSFFSTDYSSIVSNHYTIRTIRTGIRMISTIDKKLAQLHHYRVSCPPLMEEDCKKNYMKYKRKDPTLWKFKDILIKNVKKKIRDLNSIEDS